MTATERAQAFPDTSAPWLSILIPVYNVEDYLEECVRSILDQAGPGVEIILCEDVSTDGSRVLAERLADENPDRIRILYHERNRGLSAARNTMIDAATGEYIWFLDSDDTLRPGAIEAVRSAITRYDPDVVGGDYRKRKIYKGGFAGPKNTLLTDRDTIASGICLSRKMYAWLKISRRSLWDDGLRFPEGKVFEDAAVTPWLAIKADRFFHIRKALVQYRIRPGSILAGITRTPDNFRVEAHRNLAHSLGGFAAELARDPGRDYPKTRFAISHFIAMEYAKIASRIERAGPQGCGVEDIRELSESFRRDMNATSPIDFDSLLDMYRKRGRFISYIKLRSGLAAARG